MRRNHQKPSSTRRSRGFIIGSLLLVFASGFYFRQIFVLTTPLDGRTIIGSSLLRELYHSSCFQRLNDVDQSGPAYYFHRIPKFTRASHSIGVWHLLKRHGCSLEEQAAGLLHDASHTAFSHLGDYLFTDDIQKSVSMGYQDSIHLSYLEQQRIGEILAKYGLQLRDIDSDRCQALEQPLPDLCADRIEYNLHTALVMQLMTGREVKDIVSDLDFDGTYWFFHDPQLARKFSELSLRFTQNFWAAPWNVRLNIHFAAILKRGLALGALSKADLFLTDAAVLKKIQPLRSDPVVQVYWKQCERTEEDLPDISYKTVEVRPKFRGVDPFVKTEKGLVRLTTIDAGYKSRFEAVHNWCAEGYEIRIIDQERLEG